MLRCKFCIKNTSIVKLVIFGKTPRKQIFVEKIFVHVVTPEGESVIAKFFLEIWLNLDYISNLVNFKFQQVHASLVKII